MKMRAIPLAILMSTLTACGSSGTDSTTTSASTALSGVAFKGPIDNATLIISDLSGKELANGISSEGKFNFPDFQLPSIDQAIFIDSTGGAYTDEATSENVDVGTAGLSAVFTTQQLNDIINAGQVFVMTPETSIIAKLARTRINAGDTPSVAIAAAIALVQEQLIDGTTPIPMSDDDTVLLTGDLTASTPENIGEAFARNRAISFSYEAKNLNLTPLQVFELIELRATDLQDELLDGKQDGVTLSIMDKDGVVQALDDQDNVNKFSLARAELLNNTISRLSSGDLSDNERAELALLGFDADLLGQQSAANTATEAETETLLSATNLPDFQRLPVMTDEDGDASNNAARYTLTATPNVNVTVNAPGTSWVTPMSRYNSEALPQVIRANRNDAMTLNLVNGLDEATTIHWHGFEIPGDQDGGPDFPVAAADSKSYQFSLEQPAASLWFHPHPDLNTGSQVYSGLAGVFIIEDDISQQLETDNQLPTGDYDIPIMFQDRRFADEANGVRELVYLENGLDRVMGMLDNVVLVNGDQLPKLSVENRKYRIRLYNSSNARTYDFALNDGSTFSVVGSDGGLLKTPETVDHVLLGAAERAEIVIDFSRYNVDDKVMLISKPFSAFTMGNMMGGMTAGGIPSGGMIGGGTPSGGMMAGGRPINGSYLNIMRFDVASTSVETVTALYSELPANAEISTRLNEADASTTRNFVLSMTMGETDSGNMPNVDFKINDKKFDINRIDETIELNGAVKTEIWSIQNVSPMAHPFHVHAIQWQLLDRDGVTASGEDIGPQDTVLVQPGETVRIIGLFDPSTNSGKYMYHCHILEHEDAGMMGFFEIK